MLASTILVTLRGPLKTLDLELPSDIAAGELLPLLLEICAEEQNDPQAVPLVDARLHVAGVYAPLPLEKTLIDAGVCNGMVLVLQTQEQEQMTTDSGATPQQSGPSWAQPGANTGGIRVIWESLL